MNPRSSDDEGDDQDDGEYYQQPPRKQQPPARDTTPPPQPPAVAPKTAPDLREEGNTHFRAQDYKRAAECYTQAIALDPDPVYYGNRAAAYLMQELFSKAIEDCKFVLARTPDDVKAHLRAGKAYLKKGDLTDARRHLGRVLELEPSNTQVKPELQQLALVEDLAKKAAAALSAQNYRLCLTTTEQGLVISPFGVLLRTLKGEALLGLRQYGAAGSLAVAVLRDNPQNPDALYVRGMSLYYTGNMDDASKLLMSALKCDPDHAKARAARKRVRDLMTLKEEGNAQFSARQYKEAHQTYSRAMEVDPLNDALMAILHFNRALAGTKIGFQEQAIADCTAALKLDPTYLKARKLRIEVYQKVGRHREAVAELRAWSTEDPENRDLLRQLRDAEVEQKKADRPDYYAILGVPRNANDKDIKKAFKKMALLYHPDKNSATEAQRAAADVKFKQINEANEVLSNPDKRAAYDRGDDMDEVAAGGHSHNHGFGGHHHGGGGGGHPYEQFFRHAQGGGGFGGFGGGHGGGFNF